MITYFLHSNFNKIKFWILFIGVIVSTNYSCKAQEKLITEQKTSHKIKINTEGSTDEKTIMLIPFGGFSDEDIRPFTTSVEIVMDKSINDFYMLQIDNYRPEQFWLQGEDIEVNVKIENEEVKIVSVINSPFYYYTTKVLEEYEKMTGDGKNSNTGNEFLLTEISNSIDSPFSNELAFLFLNDNIDKPENLKKLYDLIVNQSDEVKNHILSVYEDVKKIISVENIQFEDFTFHNKNGQDVDLSLNEDYIYLINFWFTNCPPCILDHEKIQSKLNSFEASGIEIIGISTDSDESDWKTFLDKKEYSWSNYIEIGSKKDKISVSNYIGISSYPTYLIVNGNGEILNRNSDFDKIMVYLKESKLMKED